MLFVSSITFALEEVPSDTAKLYVKSGLKKQVDSFSSIIIVQLQAEIKKSPNKKPYKENDIKKLVKTIRDVFESPDLKKQSLAVLAQELTPDETKKLLDWFASPIGKKVAWYEDNIATRAGYLNMHEYEKGLDKNPPTQDYQNRITKLTRNMQVIETAIDMALVNEVVVNSAMASLQPNFSIEILEGITKQTERNKPNLKQQVSEYMKLPMLFTYSYLSRKELNTYLEFTSTALGKKYFLTMIKALNAVFKKAGIEYNQRLSK